MEQEFLNVGKIKNFTSDEIVVIPIHRIPEKKSSFKNMLNFKG
jgi:hypothetical protein